MMPRIASYTAVCLLLALLILLGHQLFYTQALEYEAVDDAYISFRYAQNLVRGNGLVFNPGERVEGYTNFLWTVLIAPAIALGFPPGPVSMLLGAGFALATLILLSKYLPAASQPLAGAVAALLLAADGSFALWSVSGMETALFAFLLTLGILLYLREGEDERFPIFAGLAFALATLSRPEGLLAFGVTMLHAVARRVKAEGRLVAQADLLRGGAFLGVFLPYFLWRFGYYGYLLPNTFYLKVSTEGPAAQIARGFRHLGTFLDVHLGLLLIFIALLSILRRKVAGYFAYLWSLLLAYVGYVVYVGGDWSVGRFFTPILPAFYLLVAQGLASAYQTFKEWLDARPAQLSLPVRRASSTLLLGLLAGALLWQSSINGEYGRWLVPFQAGLANEARVTLGRWLREHVPTETFIAVDAAGQVPYFSELRALDMFGINDLHTAHLRVENMGQGTPGHEKFDFNYIMSRRPDLIIVFGNFLDGSTQYLRADWPWTPDPALKGFLTIYRRWDWNVEIE